MSGLEQVSDNVLEGVEAWRESVDDRKCIEPWKGPSLCNGVHKTWSNHMGVIGGQVRRVSQACAWTLDPWKWSWPFLL